MSAPFNKKKKKEFKELGPSHKPINWLLSPMYSLAQTYTQISVISPILSFSCKQEIQSRSKAKSSLILFFCQSALIQLNEKVPPATPKTPDSAVESITVQIKSKPQCIPAQTLDVLTQPTTTLIKINNTQSSVLLMSKVGL